MVWSRDRGSDSQDDTSTNGSPGNAAVGDLKCPLHCTNNHFTLDNLKVISAISLTLYLYGMDVFRYYPPTVKSS